MAEKTEQTSKENLQQITKINQHIKVGIWQWANVVLTAEADEWAHYLDYDKEDVMSVCLLFQHVCSNIGIKGGRIDGEKAFEFGNRLHDLVEDMTGIDTRTVYGTKNESSINKIAN